MLQELDQNLWVVPAPLRVFGLEVGTRMTVVRLHDGGLWLHSPVSLSNELRVALSDLGEVKAVVAPNCYHHLFVKQYVEVYPHVLLFGAPGLEKKRSDLTFHKIIDNHGEDIWASDLEHLVTRGAPSMNEVVFFHPLSQTLLLTDICVNFPATNSFLLRLYRRYVQDYDAKFAMARLIKFMVRDRKAFRASCELILQWDFNRVTVTHGQVLEAGGREAFRKAVGWVMEEVT